MVWKLRFLFCFWVLVIPFFSTCLSLVSLPLLLARSFICWLVRFCLNTFAMLFTLNSYYSQWKHYVCAWPSFVCICKIHLHRSCMYASVRLFSSFSSSVFFPLSIYVCLLNNAANTVYLFHIVVRMHEILFFSVMKMNVLFSLSLFCRQTIYAKISEKFCKSYVNNKVFEKEKVWACGIVCLRRLMQNKTSHKTGANNNYQDH